MRASARPARRVLILLAFLLTTAAVLAQDSPSREPEPAPDPTPAVESPAGLAGAGAELDKETLDAIDKGLHRLSRLQSQNGNWRTNGQGRFDMSVTALAGLAFLAHGEVPGERKGPYGAKLDKAIDWVLKNQHNDSDPALAGLFFEYGGPLGNEDRAMHGHGFALLFLAEAYGQVSSSEPSGRARRAKIKTAIERAVKLIERSQSSDGGWFYRPQDNRDEGSITITQIQGLRAARNAGIDVPKSIIDRAVEYIKKSQNKDGPYKGGVRYMLTRGEASPALTGAGIAVYYGAGEYDSPGIDLGFEYLKKNYQLNNEAHFWFYTQLYCIQAWHQKGNPGWSTFWKDLRAKLLRDRNAKGEWEDPYAGKAFGTAVAVLCLEVPLQYLPIFQK